MSVFTEWALSPAGRWTATFYAVWVAATAAVWLIRDRKTR